MYAVRPSGERGEQRPRVREHQRVVVRRRRPGTTGSTACATSCTLFVVGSPVPMSRNCLMPASAARYLTARPRNARFSRGRGQRVGAGREHLVGRLPVRGEVVLAADEVVVHPRRSAAGRCRSPGAGLRGRSDISAIVRHADLAGIRARGKYSLARGRAGLAAWRGNTATVGACRKSTLPAGPAPSSSSASSGADAALITARPNVRYLTGLASSNAALLLPADGRRRAAGHRLPLRRRGAARRPRPRPGRGAVHRGEAGDGGVPPRRGAPRLRGARDDRRAVRRAHRRRPRA